VNSKFFMFFCFCLCRVCVIAGNISPIDVITHVPVLCEEADIPYVYVPSKEVSNQFCPEILMHFTSSVLNI
jgi:hypothetical protein